MMTNQICLKRHCILALLAFAWATPCIAELQPEEIAILAVRGSRGSERLAKYYAEARGIPEENICKLVMPKGETISHKDWTWAVRPEINKWLTDHDPDKKIRCLVTTWDVPLRIKRDPNGDQQYKQFLQGERTNRLKILRNAAQALELLGVGAELPADTAATSDSQDDSQNQKSELELIQAKLESSLKQAQARLASLLQAEEKQNGFRRLQQLATVIGGSQVILQGLNQRLQADANADPAIRADFERLRGRSIAYAETRAILERMAPGIQRDVLQLLILERTGGMLASVKWLDEHLKVVDGNESGASFDSELALVMWPDDYQLLRWQPNYLRPEYDNSQLPKTYRTLMVARLDAPTLELAKGLIDTAIKIEAEGLKGKVYLDARGIGKLDGKQVKPGGYADYDRALLITAKGLQEQTSLEVVLQTSPQLFQAGECPDAALYCGWYSLAKYVDAFDWAPGAVAYHLASSEATTLRNKDSQVWCKRMLEDGVCATIGPVNEPYLMAFPRPNEFFALLIRGELTLVECYSRTKPYNSWMMTLIGDPLYRPYASNNVWKQSDP